MFKTDNGESYRITEHESKSEPIGLINLVSRLAKIERAFWQSYLESRDLQTKLYEVKKAIDDMEIAHYKREFVELLSDNTAVDPYVEDDLEIKKRKFEDERGPILGYDTQLKFLNQRINELKTQRKGFESEWKGLNKQLSCYNRKFFVYRIRKFFDIWHAIID